MSDFLEIEICICWRSWPIIIPSRFRRISRSNYIILPSSLHFAGSLLYIVLANGLQMKFYDFAGSASQPIDVDDYFHPPKYILMNLDVILASLPPSVLPIEAKIFTYKSDNHKTTLYQFPVIVAYAIMDYKYQNFTFDRVAVDLKHSPSISLLPLPHTFDYLDAGRRSDSL